MGYINLFKISEERKNRFHLLLANYSLLSESEVDNHVLRLYFDLNRSEHDLSWGWVFDLFQLSSDKVFSQPRGILTVEQDERLYAISFGIAHFNVYPYADWDFGFNFAMRTKIVETRLTSTTVPNSKKNKQISAYHHFDHLEISSGESFTKIKARVDIGENDDVVSDLIEVGSSLKFNLKNPTLEHIVRVVSYVEEVLLRPIQTKIPVFNRITDKGEKAVLDESLVANFSPTSSSLMLSEFDVSGVEAVFNRADCYRCLSVEHEGPIEVFDLQHLFQYFEEVHISDRNAMLDTRIQFFNEGRSTFSKRVRELIDFYDDEHHALLINGQWYRFNDDFLEVLKSSLNEIPVVYNPVYDIPPNYFDNYRMSIFRERREDEQYREWSDKKLLAKVKNEYYAEYIFNIERVNNDGFVLGDRHTIPVGRSRIEPYDLKNDEAILAVKRGDNSSELCYVVTQSELSIEYAKKCERSERPKKMVLWLILNRRQHLGLENGVLSWDDLGALLLKVRIAEWSKKVRLANMVPEIWINYEM